MKPGWAILITVLVLGTVAGIICGIYFAGLNKVDKYMPNIPPAAVKAVNSVKAVKSNMLSLASQGTCDGKVVNPAIPCVSNNKSNRVCTGCNSSQQCLNNQCQNLCAPNCPLNACQGTGNGPSSGISDGCGGSCCGCLAPATCVSGTCTAPSTCQPACGAGMICKSGQCVSTCNPACSNGQTCVNGQCITPGGCSPVCTVNEVCQNGKCACVPNCPANSCGSDGCGNICACSSGQVCENQTCSSCSPTCATGACGSSNGCGGVCACSSGQICKDSKCVTDTNPWEGWSTTTQFGAGDGPWGNNDPAEYLPAINDVTTGRMGGAITWKEICNRYGTKQKQIDSVVGSAAGTNTDKSCFLVQPINKYPDQISGLSDPLFPNANMCDPTKSNCTDINDSSLLAVDGNGTPYPSYLIFPFEGCGGNCKVTSGSGADCVNDCISGTDQLPGIMCQWDKTTGPLCDAAKILYDNGNWGWNDTIKTNFEKYSDITAIDPRTGYGRNIAEVIANLNEDHANYCSGQNMHMDMAETTPFWMNPNLPKGNIAYLTADSNIMMRYKRVPCNYFGNLDINVPASADTPCPEGYYSIDLDGLCSTSTLKPNDPNWLNSNLATHACCKSGTGSVKCTAGQVYEPECGACPCPSGECFYALTAPGDGSSGNCGQCSASPAACAQGTKC